MLILSIAAPFWIWRWTPLLRNFARQGRHGYAAMAAFWVLAGVVIMALGCMNTALRFGYEPLWLFGVVPLLIPLGIWHLEEQKGA